MFIVDEHLTLRKNNQDDDSYQYGLRGNDSDGDEYSRRNDAEVTSNADILQRRGKDYDSSSTGRPFINTPQYHLIPTEEEESERRQSAKGQQLERMQRRRNARLSRQAAGVSKAKDLPGFRGEEPLENLINYIDAPAQTSRKSKKKKKKISPADNVDAGMEKLANSCEVFVGTSGVSSDEPSVRVGDSCCIELRKKSDCDSLPDTTSAAVDTNLYSPDDPACFDSSIADKNVLVTSTEASIDPDVDSENAPADLLNNRLAEDLPEVVYTEVKNAALEEEDVCESLTEPDTTTVAGDETLAVNCETTSSISNGHHTAYDVELISVESGKAENMTDSVCSRTVEYVAENAVDSPAAVSDGQLDLDSFLPALIGSDSVTSDTGSVEDMFVTVQKKKRSKNSAAVVAEDPRQRFGRRSSIKGVEDRETSYYTKRSWVKSSDTTSIGPSVSVSRSSIVYSKPSCPVTQRSGVVAAKYSQASNPDTVLSSAVSSKPMNKSSSSSLLVEAEHEGTSEQNSTYESAVIYSTSSSSHRNTNDVMHRSTDSEKSALESDSVKPLNSSLPVDGVVAVHWQASVPSTLVFECSNKTNSSPSSDMPVGTGSNELSKASNSVDDKQNECADIQIDITASNPNIPSQAGEDQSVDIQSNEGKKSSQPPVQIVSSSDVFLDTRNIAGTTPPRSDISFGFDPGSSPESSSDVSVSSQHVNPSGGAFTAVAASCHCPVVAPLPPPAAGCAPILYFYPAMPVTILPPVATYTTGRCTPIGVVPPMPAVAGVTNISVAPPAWQPSEDKCISAPVEQDDQNVVVNDDSPASDVTPPSTTNKATNEFVLYAAQRYLYSGMLSSYLLL